MNTNVPMLLARPKPGHYLLAPASVSGFISMLSPPIDCLTSASILALFAASEARSLREYRLYAMAAPATITRRIANQVDW